MRVLIETRMNALRLNESKSPKKGCLGRLEGVCADFKNPTRNGRLYPLELWEKVFADALFKESLENKTLFGELDHPEDRFEPLISEACVVMTDYTIDKNKGLIYGGFDILDTPKGRILKSILDYGSVVGVSSRGQGDIIEDVDGERVDENSYEFACFDVVSTPAVAKARQTVAESIKRINSETFFESVSREIKEAETVADLNIIRSVVRTSKIDASEIDSLIESIEDKCKLLQSGETISETKSDNGKENLLESTKSNKMSANTIRDNKKLYRCIKDLREQLSAYKHRERRYIETLSEKDNKISNLSDSVMRLESTNRSYINKQKRIMENLDRKTNESLIKSDRIKKLTEDSNIRRNELMEKLSKTNDRLDNTNSLLEDTQRQLTSCKKKLMSVNSDNENLIKSEKALKAELSSLREQLSNETSKSRSAVSDSRRLKEHIDSLMQTNSSLEEQVDILKQRLDEAKSSLEDSEKYYELYEDAQSRIENSNSTIDELEDTLTTTKQKLSESCETNKKLISDVKKYQESYLRRVAIANGLNPNDIKNSISGIVTPQKIDTIVESIRDTIDRNNKIGITDDGISLNDGLIVESISARPKSEDDYAETQRLENWLGLATNSR